MMSVDIHIATIVDAIEEHGNLLSFLFFVDDKSLSVPADASMQMGYRARQFAVEFLTDTPIMG